MHLKPIMLAGLLLGATTAFAHHTAPEEQHHTFVPAESSYQSSSIASPISGPQSQSSFVTAVRSSVSASASVFVSASASVSTSASAPISVSVSVSVSVSASVSPSPTPSATITSSRKKGPLWPHWTPVIKSFTPTHRYTFKKASPSATLSPSANRMADKDWPPLIWTRPQKWDDGDNANNMAQFLADDDELEPEEDPSVGDEEMDKRIEIMKAHIDAHKAKQYEEGPIAVDEDIEAMIAGIELERSERERNGEKNNKKQGGGESEIMTGNLNLPSFRAAVVNKRVS
ncbi:hypothetical protein QBC44DRAFT_393703 [Cladorrhinum sp. PSN332]|nr:hypothetical protein QBC44DRAFT_393703 [Cladorrhinum sp. PSN332]